MPESENSIDYVMEKASGPHFSGLHIDGIRSPSSSPRAPSASIPVDSNLPKQPFVIGVSGGSASGKTTVCDMIIQQLHDHRVVLVNQDSFYRGLNAEELERVHEYNFDHPEAFDTEQLLECAGKLKNGQPVQVPIYDFKTHQRRTDTFRQVNASDVIIMEGILVFHDQRVRNMMNMKIFVDTDADVRLARRIRRDTVERNRDINSVLEQYAKFVKPAFDDFVLPSKKYADVIIPRGGDNHVAIDLIVQHIRTKLGQHDLCKIYTNVYVIQSTFQIRGMHTLIRDRDISKHDFVFYSDRLIHLVVEHGLGHLPFTEKQVVTPTGSVYIGVDFCKKLCGVSIVRSSLTQYTGVTMERGFNDLDMIRRMVELNADRTGDVVPEEPAAIAPRGLERARQDVANPNSAIEKYMSTPLEITGIHDKFKDFADVSLDMTAMTTDYKDQTKIKDPALVLSHGMSVEDFLSLGREVLPMLSSGFSPYGAGALLVLSYGLRDPGDTSLYVLPPTECNFADVPLTILSKRISATRVSAPLPPLEDSTAEATAYAFVAASTLRLFSKSEENYVKAWNHILSGYQRFYGENISISLAAPTVEALKTMTHQFSYNAVLKNTLYRILYYGGDCSSAPGLRRFLYELHLANTGLHSISIFARLCQILNCNPSLLLSALNEKEFSRQVDAMCHVMKLVMNTGDDYKRKMWRYGRIFDDTFMSSLQTKSCTKFAYVLASALKSEASQSNQNILDIVPFRDLSGDMKFKLDFVALKFVRGVRAYNSQGGTGFLSILYHGESMENALRACCKGIKIGKILIHREGDYGKQPIYEKLPKDISERHVLLLDPVLATGNSACHAIELLIQKGVPESHIIFLNLISAPEGVHCVSKRFPSLKIVTSEIDVAINEEFRVIPGLGEFRDRYFGTDD